MKHYTGFYFCTLSNWDDNIFDANNLVSIDNDDFKELIIKNPINIERPWETYCELKLEVYDWLTNNVKNKKNGVKSWCCGNKEYNSRNHCDEFSIFFYRRKDAQLFIKIWSKYKKPTETYNQNTYIQKKLNFETGKLEITKK